jgi:hypothetical protein
MSLICAGLEVQADLAAVQRAVAGISCIRPLAPALRLQRRHEAGFLPDQAEHEGRVQPAFAGGGR